MNSFDAIFEAAEPFCFNTEGSPTRSMRTAMNAMLVREAIEEHGHHTLPKTHIDQVSAIFATLVEDYGACDDELRDKIATIMRTIGGFAGIEVDVTVTPIYDTNEIPVGKCHEVFIGGPGLPTQRSGYGFTLASE